MMYTSVHAKEWRGFTPLRSMRSDVRRKLGTPSKIEKLNDKEIEWYRLAKEDVQISFALGTCKGGRQSGWRVPAGTVVQIAVFPKGLKVTQLPFDLSRYKKSPDPEVEALEHIRTC